MNQLYIEKYVKDDKCDWLVLLHGFGGSTKMWKKQIDFFKDKFNLLLVDLPGHGSSKLGVLDFKSKSFTDIADIIVTVLKSNDIHIANFMCVSLGTLVFAGILEKYPDIVNCGILCGAVAGINYFLHIFLKFISKVQKCFPYMFLMKIFSYVLLPRKSHKSSRDFFIRSGRLLGKSEFIAWFSLVISDIDILKNLSYLPNKLLFVMGNEDYTFLNGVKKKLNSFKNCGLSIINRCGHVCNIQKYDEFNSISFLYLQDTLQKI